MLRAMGGVRRFLRGRQVRHEVAVELGRALMGDAMPGLVEREQQALVVGSDTALVRAHRGLVCGGFPDARSVQDSPP